MGLQIRYSHARIDHIRVGHVSMHGEGKGHFMHDSFRIRHGEDDGGRGHPLTGPLTSAKSVQKARGPWNPHLPKLAQSSEGGFPFLIHGERLERSMRVARNSILR